MLQIKKFGRKILAALLVTAIVAATGCGAKSSPSSTEGNETTGNESGSTNITKEAASGDTSKSNAEMTKIVVYRPSFNIGAPDSNEVQKVQDEINKYIADKINVQIELHEIGSADYKDKANMALSNGEIDLFWTSNWIETIPTNILVKQNAVADLTDKLQKYDVYKALPEFVWGSSSFNSKNYFIPCLKEAAEGYNLMFRKDLIDKYGWDLTTVKGLKDIEPMLEQCKADGIKYPYLTQKTAMFYRYYINKFDSFSQDHLLALDKDQDTVVNVVATPEYKDFASLMGDWAQKGYLSEDDLTKTTTDQTTQTKDWGISWWTDIPDNNQADTRYKQAVEMVHITDNWKQSNGALGACYAISATCTEAEIDASLKFMSLVNTDTTLADLYTFGIEGTDYNKVDGKVQITDAGLFDHDAWEAGNVNVISLEAGEPDNKVELYTTFNETAKDSIADGFRFDTTSIDAQYAACVQVFNEFGFALENGGFKPDEVANAIADYQKALDNAGFQAVLTEAQKQYEAWKQTK